MSELYIDIFNKINIKEKNKHIQALTNHYKQEFHFFHPSFIINIEIYLFVLQSHSQNQLFVEELNSLLLLMYENHYKQVFQVDYVYFHQVNSLINAVDVHLQLFK
jgi:hypothetical protein